MVMHYEFMDTINWPAIVGAKRVLIVVHPELMRELNELKDSKDKAKKTRERAAKVIRHLGQMFSGALVASGRPNVEICFEADEPEPGIFADNNLNNQFGDGCHLASVLKRQSDNPDEKVLLVTHDTGVQLRARAKGVSYMDAPAQHRLPEGQDPLEERNRQLEQELASYKARTPHILLQWDTGTSHIRIIKDANAVNDQRPEVKAPLAYRTVRLDLSVINDGQAPATDTDIILKLPDGLHIMDERGMRNYWEMPENADLDYIMKRFVEKRSGRLGETALQRIGRGLVDKLDYGAFQDLVATRRAQRGDLVASPTRPQLKGNHVKYHIKKLKHSLPYLLESIYVVFGSDADISSFDIQFTVSAHELPINKQGRLHVVINRANGI